MVSITPAFNPANSISGVYNFDPKNYPNLRAGLAKMRDGVTNLRIACVGDSTTYGEGSAGSGTVGCVAKAWPARLATLLSNSGIPAVSSSFWCDGNNGANATQVAADPRLTIAANWNVTGSLTSLGGKMLRMAQSAADITSLASFAPGVNANQFDIYYPTNGVLGTVAHDIDGGAATNQAQTTGGGFAKVTLTAGAVGLHTLNTKRISGGDCYLAGISAYDNTSKRVEVWNMGSRGWKASDWNDASSGWSPRPALIFAAPHLAIISLTINDREALADPTTAITNLDATIVAWQAAGIDVWLVNPHPTDPTGGHATQATQTAYLAALYAEALKRNVPLIDLAYPDANWTVTGTLGFNYDALHRSGPGYWDVARIFNKLLQAI